MASWNLSPVNELSAKSCAELFDVSLGCWYEWMKNDPSAPKPIHEAPRFKRWDAAEVLAYRELLREEKRTGYGKKKAAA
ncbi:hypothetical protein FACS1894216_02230 [Synergistales bacterium]|nr:hypothetical protein FACS1894216_02230 [Synergistales bacterium]